MEAPPEFQLDLGQTPRETVPTFARMSECNAGLAGRRCGSAARTVRICVAKAGNFEREAACELFEARLAQQTIKLRSGETHLSAVFVGDCFARNVVTLGDEQSRTVAIDSTSTHVGNDFERLAQCFGHSKGNVDLRRRT